MQEQINLKMCLPHIAFQVKERALIKHGFLQQDMDMLLMDLVEKQVMEFGVQLIRDKTETNCYIN